MSKKNDAEFEISCMFCGHEMQVIDGDDHVAECIRCDKCGAEYDVMDLGHMTEDEFEADQELKRLLDQLEIELEEAEHYEDAEIEAAMDERKSATLH